MKLVTHFALSICVLGAGAADANSPPAASGIGHADTMVVTRNGAQPSAKGPVAFFSGSVRVDPVFPSRGPSQPTGGLVTFEPSARSAWHTHPLGQTLVVMAGAGWVQQEGGTKIEMKPGDVIWTPPGVKHWHGATATTGVTHLAVTAAENGKNVEWLEKVADADYHR